MRDVWRFFGADRVSCECFSDSEIGECGSSTDVISNGNGADDDDDDDDGNDDDDDDDGGDDGDDDDDDGDCRDGNDDDFSIAEGSPTADGDRTIRVSDISSSSSSRIGARLRAGDVMATVVDVVVVVVDLQWNPPSNAS